MLGSSGKSKVSFLTSLRVSDMPVSLAIYLLTHLPVENLEINLFKVSCTPWGNQESSQLFLKKCKKKTPATTQKAPPEQHDNGYVLNLLV